MNARPSPYPPWPLWLLAGLCGLGLALPLGRPATPTAQDHATLGPTRGCSCHYDKIAWWRGDAHYRAAEALLSGSERAVAIARQAGLSADEMTRGNQPCMRCHGTVVTGQEAQAIAEGASCESCHGPGGDYRRKHQPPGGYATAAAHGMVRLEDLPARAAACARCHHVTDAALLAAGHPDGEDFNLGRRDAQIRHWEAPTPATADLDDAYARAVGGRPAPVAAAPPPATSAPVENPTPAAVTPATPAPPAPSARLPAAQQVAAPPQAAALALPPFETASDTASAEALLLTAKQRLELLYRALGRGH